MSLSRGSRRLWALLVVVPLAVGGFLLPAPSVSAGAAQPPAVPVSGAYFGSSASTRTGESQQDAITRTERQLGRKLAVDHQFYKWDHTLPAPHQSWDVAGGRIPFVSWKPQRKDGSAVSWTRIASGAEDAWIAAQADRIRDFGQPLFMVFNHEPYDQSKSGWGAPSDFVAAWRRIVDTFRSRGATNVAWTLVLTGYDYSVSGRPEAFYAGDGYVDWIAADPYNWFTRDRSWTDLGQVTSAFYNWGSAQGKPLMLAEWGTEEDPATPGRKAQWYDNARAWLKSRPNIKAVVYFNNKHDYEWSIDTSTSSLAAFAAMAGDPWFNPQPLSVPVPVPGGVSPVPVGVAPIGVVPVGLGPVGVGVAVPSPGAPATAGTSSGYWMVGADGRVFTFGNAVHLGEADSLPGAAVDLEPTPASTGYWILGDRGHVHAYGTATHHGNATGLATGERATSLSATPTGNGYRIFTSHGRVLAFGDASLQGDMTGFTLNAPVLDSVATPTGQGYYMVAADGGIFTFGDATFAGSMGARRLNAPVQSMVPDPDGSGYWLVASDGGVFSFDAPFHGSMGATPLNRPITGMVAYGDGYLMVGEDGGTFNFSTHPYRGSLGTKPPQHPITAIATTD